MTDISSNLSGFSFSLCVVVIFFGVVLFVLVIAEFIFTRLFDLVSPARRRERIRRRQEQWWRDRYDRRLQRPAPARSPKGKSPAAITPKPVVRTSGDDSFGKLDAPGKVAQFIDRDRCRKRDEEASVPARRIGS